ncbi:MULTISPECIES: lytic polysaccharide monooxygenase [unclassified Streptomyces]|uniref:lytic polysaccharide monooxygenase n=1 Tax=unclassified Streptomyces TaxID=2593676 RepID=UPI002E2BDE17|nr:lytic polysaccharide monooxygenase [Streptomyces sp. NBC_01423]WSX90717.1 lytic polysaccharide monooxygenase [Streptomyces sp. NBC_00891]WSY05198.1 lytic polysaccharide monooxygenase [Streptomyces sp. NBC_00890]WSZ06822.1 lytic polysaccharide monooxygenase [Streptomyces sp. NBC_00869]WSZ25679.1 lytic polysaccharide monooxygenase [Streptomyces sp. NBC_00870]
MNAKRRMAVSIGALVAPVLALGVQAGIASAHGWVTAPTSRQAQCAAGVVDCGQIKYEPQSVEGPKGLKSCSGGNAAFAELDDDSKGWQVTPVGRTYTFTWHHTARHATDNWQYFIGDQKIAEFAGNHAQPPADVSQEVDFGSFTGRQKVLAVWNVADTANAFYACVDVNIGSTGENGGGDGGNPGGGDGDGDGGDPGDCAVPLWSTEAVYTGGDTVSYDGHTWRAKWWVKGDKPGTTGEWGVWEDLGVCAA